MPRLARANTPMRTHTHTHTHTQHTRRSYLVIETRKDGTKFTNRALKEAAERQGDVAARYEALQRDLVAQARGCV
jgi:DNA mismatch repair protein MSH2